MCRSKNSVIDEVLEEKAYYRDVSFRKIVRRVGECVSFDYCAHGGV